jgi:DnaA family protein
MKQGGLPISLNVKMSLVHFFGEKNQQLLAFVQKLLVEKSSSVVFVHSRCAYGKTHFLQGCAFAALNKDLSVFYMDVAQELPDGLINTLKNYDWICLDNIDALSAQQAQDLFDLYNNIKPTSSKLIVSSHCLPSELKVLPDLKTRLSLAFVFELAWLSDADKIHIIEQKIKQQKMHIDTGVYAYLFKHYSRDLNQILNAIELLDEASLQQKSKISIALAKKTLSW